MKSAAIEEPGVADWARPLPLDEWCATGQATVVKKGVHRAVYRVRVGASDVHVKQETGGNGLLQQMRCLLQGSKARREFDLLTAVARRGVPTLEALGFRTDGQGSYLVTRTLDGARSLGTFLDKDWSGLGAKQQTAMRQGFAVALGRLLARMHDAGVTHGDLHPGNVLFRWDEHGEPRLWLIDLDAVRLSGPLGWRESRANLALLNRYFMLRSTRSDRLRFWNAYRAARQTAIGLLRDADACRDVERATLASNIGFWRRQDKNCLGDNRRFRRVRGVGVRGHVVHDFPVEQLKALALDPDGPFAAAGIRVLKDSPSSTVVECDLASADGGTRRVIYKRFMCTSRRDPWTSLLRPTAALRSWVMGHALRLRFLPTPRPLAMFQRTRFGMAYEGYLLTEKVSDAVELDRCVQHVLGQGQRGRAALWAVTERVALVVRTMHARRVSHRDLKAANVLLQTTPHESTPKVWLIDLVGVRRALYLSRRRRVQNLARLHASFAHTPGVTRTDKVRFLRSYLGWGLHGREGWKEWWREVEAATRAKEARNRRNRRPLA